MAVSHEARAIPLRDMFVDEHRERIAFGNVRTPHTNGPGYQRDPYSRIRWVEKRPFNSDICGALTVSDRADGTYAVIDGGGRWVMAQLAGLDAVNCRVHTGLTRAEEGLMFRALADRYNLRSIDMFLQGLGSNMEAEVAMAEAVRPYRVDRKGPNTIKCVVAFATIYVAFDRGSIGLQVISRTARVLAKAWSFYDEQTQTFTGRSKPIEAKHFLAASEVIEVAGENLNEDALVRALLPDPNQRPRGLTSVDLDRAVSQELGNSAKASSFVRRAAQLIAEAYNSRLPRGSSSRISTRDIDDCTIQEQVNQGKTYNALMSIADEEEVLQEAAE